MSGLQKESEKKFELTPDEVKITFTQEKNRVTGITIETPRLKLVAITTQVIKEHPEIIKNSPYYDKQVMVNFADGKPRDEAHAEGRCTTWAKRLEVDQDFFTGFAGFDKNIGAFMGLIIPGHDEEKGSSQLAGLIHKEYWNNRYGSEAAVAIMYYYAMLAQRGCKVDKCSFKKVVITVDIENPHSEKILKRLGMISDGSTSSDKYGRIKRTYYIGIDKLQKLYNKNQQTETPYSLWTKRPSLYTVATLLTASAAFFVAYRIATQNTITQSSHTKKPI